MIKLGIVLALTGIILLIAAAAQAIQNRSYALSSGDATATVTHKSRIRTKRATRYELTVAYTVDGVDYTRRVGATPAEYNTTLSEGDQIPIKYKPDNPKKAVRSRDLQPKNVRVILITGAALLAVGAVLFLLG